MTKDERIEALSVMSYQQLLHLRRFEPMGSPWFRGDEVSEAFENYFKIESAKLTQEQRVAASKNIGWEI